MRRVKAPGKAALLLYLSFLCLPLSAQTAAPAAPKTVQIKDLRIPRLTTKPRLEEFLNGHSREDMLRIDDFRQRNPGDGAPVSRHTSAWIGYDEKDFYAAFVCESPPEKTRANVGKREDILNDDMVGLFLDTYHDHQRSYEFFVNPLGIQADAITSEGQNDDFSFDTLWNSEGRITSNGFVILMAIPFKSLRFAARDVQTWGLGVGRFIPANNESSFWPYVTNRVSGFSPQLGNLAGLESIAPSRNLQLIPYVSLGHTHFLDNPGTTGANPVFRTETDRNIGLDAKMILHDSLSLDIALKPDFSQVESDDPQPTVNQRYEVQFSEKRPFFIENNGFFVTPEQLFFSRRIIDPDYGARLTGKLGRWDLGFLTIDDKAAGIAVGPGDPNYGKNALVGVARVMREFGTQSNIGFLMTDREFAGGFNRVAAIDTRIKLSTNWTLNMQAMISQTQTAVTPATAAAKYGGDAYNVNLQAQHRNYFYNLQYIDRAEGFETDLGFVTRVNIRQIQQFYQYRWHPKKYLISWGPQMFLLGDLDHKNVQQDWVVRPGVNFELPRSTFFGANHGELFERFDNINFRRTDSGVGWHSEYFKQAILDGNYTWGTRIDYSTPAGVNAFLGRGNELQSTITLRPAARVRLDEIYDLTRLRTDPDSFASWMLAPVAHPAAVFTNHLIRSRLNFQYNKQLSLRVIVDYNILLQNAALISLNREKQVTGDVLLTWLLHPGTAVYAGYTDRLENVALEPGLGPGAVNTVLQTNLPGATTQRQFFAKVSYLFRF
ncbi:MAG TPA: DUF5916 domain-containing protein [Bryobacteraceae bacterium]|jgi:hypothetical protein|nr:DUF5916 domain-containing protein [Bryobacteraceae bacterium]